MVTAIANKLEPLLFVFYLAILVWAPLPFASNRFWGGGLLAVLVALTLVGWLLLYLQCKVRLHAQVWQWAKLPLALLLVVQLWVAVQLVDLPRPVVEFVSAQAFQWHIREGWLSLSLDPEYGKYYLLQGVTVAAGFFLTLALVNSRRRLKILLQVLVLSGVLQASYGAFMVLSGLELGFFVEKYVGRGLATGTFVNANHLAGYLVMCLTAGIGLLLSQLDSRRMLGFKERARSWLRLLLDAKLRLRIYLAIMVIALVLTRSRMGNIAFFTALGIAGAISLYAARRFSVSVVLFLSSLLLIDVLIVGRWFGFDKLLRRLEQSNPAEEARVWSNEYTLDYVEQFPLSGSGGGSFYGIFPNFQADNLEGYHVHAHNDYLEFAAELGLLATLLLVSVVALSLRSAYWALGHRGSALYRGGAFAVVMTILWAAIHSTTDFNLQIPANALTFMTILALAFVCRGLDRAEHTR
jgi:O-antigen ligase